MRIALISTCSVATPPRSYGGIERFVATLATGLVQRGHDVVLYATGDSNPPCPVRACFDRAVWPIDQDAERRHARFAWRDIRRFDPDVVHCNLPEALDGELAAQLPTVITIHHERIEARLPDYLGTGAECVALSRDHAQRLPELGPPQFVHHGLDVDRFPEGDGEGGYVAFLGRIGPEKAPHVAIEAARLARVPLRLAGPHWPGSARYDAYYSGQFMPALERADGLAVWHGETRADQCRSLLAAAAALLMPLGWDEPFGLVAIEAMLVGTPVVAFRRGRMPELIDQGLTGYVVDDADGMARAIPRARRLDRTKVRERARARFSAARMTADYEALYTAMIARIAAPRAA
jgi:glycosyltransferase involved in cell wall biosynthesis